MPKPFNKIRLSYLEDMINDYEPPVEFKVFDSPFQAPQMMEMVEPLYGQNVSVIYGSKSGDETARSGKLTRASDVRANPDEWTRNGMEITHGLPSVDCILLEYNTGVLSFVTGWGALDKGEFLAIDIPKGLIVIGSRDFIDKKMSER